MAPRSAAARHVGVEDPSAKANLTAAEVTTKGNYIFRVCFIDPFQGGVMAKFAVNDLKARKLAVLYDVNSDYSQGLRQFFTEEVKRSGGQVVLVQVAIAANVRI